ncbi:MAG: DNA polymerase III subunit delta [Cyclobacteriaceae bacterium]|nr:DNA polymerase III subunit delta [Cyclobacteriaceae bacterium]UYN85286.1 MAG: DNA polymerase III subunit delta [Cyclobacteriaceae bacterium]
MDASVKKIMAALKARKFDPVYFLQGEESYFIDIIADHIEQHALSDAEKGFNQVILYGKDVTMATVLTNARRFPMMAEKQVVIVKEAQDIQDLNKELGTKLLLEYLKQPVPSTILVFCHKHKSLDKRKELGKNIEKLATTISGKKLYDNQLPDFLADYAREKQVSIDGQALQALCEFVGNDLNRLTNEFDKVTIGMALGEPVTVDHVLAKVGISKEYNIFELQKAIIHRDRLQAARIVNYFERNTKKNPVIPVVAFLYAFFSKLLIASSASDKSEKGLLSVLKISSYAIRDYALALRYYQTLKIVENIYLLKEADLKLKGVNTGSADEGQLLRELVYRLMN